MALLALLALGRKADALRYAEDSRGRNSPDAVISQTCEDILLSSGLAEDAAEAYTRYAIEGNQVTTYLATFRAIAKKYPLKAPADILRDLAASTPGEESKWFAAAKSAGLLTQAIALVAQSPTDPRTLTRAALDHGQTHPSFALDAALAALHWMAQGRGYDITAADVHEAFQAALVASKKRRPQRSAHGGRGPGLAGRVGGSAAEFGEDVGEGVVGMRFCTEYSR